jgi:hypothetical protein
MLPDLEAQMLWLLLGCHQELETKTSSNTALPELSLTLPQGAATAGIPVAYSAILIWPDDNGEVTASSRAEYVDASFSSDLQPEFRTGESLPEGAEDLEGTANGTFTPTVAGDHQLVGSVLYGETVFEQTIPYRVLSAEAVSLDLSLSAAQTPAGEPLTWTLIAKDRFSNLVNTDAAQVAGDSSEVVVVAPGVAATVPGVYGLKATLDDLEDTEYFRVVGGEAVEVLLTLSDTDIEVFETAVAEVKAWDIYDNLLTGPGGAMPELVVTGGDNRINGDAITFNEEGWFTVTAIVDGVADNVGPFLIDSTGPDLVIDPPERGAFEQIGPFMVGGSVFDTWSSIQSLTINGDSVSVAGDGSFSHEVDWDFGINLLDTIVTDSDGNITSDTRSVMAGDYLPYGYGLPDGIDARINESGFDSIEVLGEGMINDLDLATLIPNPVANEEAEDCFLGICVTWYSITLYATNPSIGSTDLELDPDPGGWINTTFTVYSPSIDWSADGSVTGIGFSGSGTIYASSITIDMDLIPSVQNGVLSITVANPSVSSVGFTFDWDSWIYDVMSFFGLDLSGLIQGYMEDAITGMLQDEVPQMLADTLGSLEIAYDIELLDNTYSLEAVPWRAEVNDYGMTLGLETWFAVANWLHFEQGPGSLYGGYQLPTFSSTTPGMQALLSLDFLNQALYALWGGGALDQRLDAAALGLDLSSFGDILGWSELNIVTVPLTPPVVVPGTGNSMLDLQLGDLELTLYNGTPETGEIALQVYISAIVGLDLDVTADGLLSPTIGDIDLTFDAVVPASNTRYSADTEALLEGLLPAVLPGLLGGLGAIPVPELEGFGLNITSFSLEGTESGYFTIGGDLVFN